MRSNTIFYCPAWGEVYQEALYREVQEQTGMKCYGTDGQQFNLRTLREHSPDYIHLHWVHGFCQPGNEASEKITLATIKALRRGGTRVFWTMHNLTRHDTQGSLADLAFRQRLMKYVDRIIVHCEGAKRYVPGHARGKVSVIPHPTYHGVYANSLTAPPLGRGIARSRILGWFPGIGEDSFVFLFFGMIRPYKGLYDLVPAFETLYNNTRTDVHLVVAGRPFSGAARRSCEYWDEKHSNIHFMEGPIPDNHLAYLFRGADLVVLPYREVLTSGVAALSATFQTQFIAPAMGCLKRGETPYLDRYALTYGPEGQFGSLYHALENGYVDREIRDEQDPLIEKYSFKEVVRDYYCRLFRKRFRPLRSTMPDTVASIAGHMPPFGG